MIKFPEFQLSSFLIGWLIILQSVCCPPGKLHSQTLKEDFSFLLKNHPALELLDVKQEGAPSSIKSASVSEQKLLGLFFIRGYQLLLSSQDIPSCNFAPSCSRFSSEALQKTDFLRGLFLSSDRLQRCNGFPGMARHYHFLPDVGKFADPVEHYLEANESDETKE